MIGYNVSIWENKKLWRQVVVMIANNSNVLNATTCTLKMQNGELYAYFITVKNIDA